MLVVFHTKFHLVRIIRIGLIFILFAPVFAFAQQDSTQQIKDRLSKLDSSNNRVNHKIDSAQGKVNSLFNPDLNQIGKNALNKNKAKQDSISFYKRKERDKKKVQKKLESAKKNNEPVDKYIAQLDSIDKLQYAPRTSSSRSDHQRLNTLNDQVTHPIDSLKGVNLSLSAMSNKMDSIKQANPLNEVSKAQFKIDQAEGKLNAPANKIDGTVNEKLDLMRQQGGAGANVPDNVIAPNTQLNTDLNLNGASLPSQSGVNVNNPLGKTDSPLGSQLGEANQLKGQVNEVKGIPQEQIGKVKGLDEVSAAQDKLGKANAITDKAQGYGDDLKNVSQGNLGELKEAPKALEQQVTRIDEVGGIQKEAAQFDQYKQMGDKVGDPEVLKQEALKQAQEQAMASLSVDHFEGKQELLKTAMDKVSKVKSKYSEVSSLKDLPKRKPNEMKGKPFIERLTPGITLQLQKSGNLLLDYNPYLGYRFYGRFTAGAGWNERVGIAKHVHLTLKDRIYGPRVFADYKIGRGFSVRTDIEKMNTYIPSLASPNDFDHRAWIWSAFIGLKKEYQFVKKVKGTVHFLYNLYDDHDNSPYGDRLIVRMGFEFPMKKKHPKSGN